MSLRQFVTFRTNDNLVGINILHVREINRVLDITPVQNTPPYVRGLVNLRGQTVTVFDLGIRLGLYKRDITEDTHNVILKQENVGLLVDSIGDVVEVDEENIEPPPANLGDIRVGFSSGVVRLENEILVILSTEKILEYIPATSDGMDDKH